MSGPDITNFFNDSNALDAGISINGGWESVNTDYILISINTDTQTVIYLQHSHDSITVDYTDTVTYTNTGTSQNYIYSRKASFIQIRLENTSSSNQTTLRCYREFIGLPATTNVFNSNLYTQLTTTNNLLTTIDSNISSIVGGTLDVSFATGSNVIVDQSNPIALQTLAHGSNDGGITGLPLLVNSSGALVTSGGGTTYGTPLVSQSITNLGTVLRNGTGTLRGYHVTSILNTHGIIGLYDTNTVPTHSHTPLVHIPISKAGDITMILDGGGLTFSNGLSVRGCSTFDITRNIDVKPGMLAGSFYWTT